MKNVTLTNEEIGSLTMALSHLIHAGIPAGDALVLLGQDEEDAAVRQLLASMASAVDAGCSLATAVGESGAFPPYVCKLLAVGEQVGKTEETLAALSAHYTRRHRLARQLKAALSYPAMLFGVLLVVVAALLIWVLPVFDEVYARLGAKLTGIAGWLLVLGQVLKQTLPLWLGLIVAVGCAAGIPTFRRRIAGFIRTRWGHRGVLGGINAARFLQAVNLGIASGMTNREAVAMAIEPDAAPAFRDRCQRCLEEVEGGSALSKAFRQAKLLEAADCRLLEAGERSGRSAGVLESLSEKLLEESEEALEALSAKAEPVMVAAACVLIGTVLLTVLLPLVHILSAIG